MHTPASAFGHAPGLWRRFIPAAVLEDDEAARAARILFVLLAVGLTIDLVMGLWSVIVYPVASLGTLVVINGPRIVVFLGLLLLLRTGRIRAASTVFVYSLWVFTTFGVWVEGGLRSPMLTLFFPLILIAALLLGWKTALVVTALSFGSTLVIYVLESTGELPAGSVTPTFSRLWTGYCISLTIVVAVALLANFELRRTNRALRSEIEERGLLEEELLHAQKMEAVGRLASGLAHDVNNHLAVISANCEALGEMLEDRSEGQTRVGRIIDAIERTSKLTRQLLVFSRSDKPDARMVDLNRIVDDAAEMLRPTLGTDVDLSLSLSPDLALIRVDPTRIQQVLLNLSINAYDAMPEGGTLHVETGNLNVGEQNAVPPGRYVGLTIRDTGEGMEPEVLSRAFDPFFTTKSEGVGTGLGLAVVRGIVSEAHGHITLESEPGRGTTFKLFFPQPPPSVPEQPEVAELVM